jgi:ATP adenylyltransferase
MMSDNCLFCTLPPERIIAKNDLALAVRDIFPVTTGHSLIIPQRHVEDYFDLTPSERQAIEALAHNCREELMLEYPEIDGFNIGANSGASAGQTIFHVHVHLIPRRTGDTPLPRGGIRGVIPEKQSY